MAAKLYGGAYLSSFVDSVLDNVSKILEDDSVLYGNHSANKFLKKLKKCLLVDVAPFLDDAELKQFTDKNVKKWLVDLQDALYMADDFLDELSTKAATATATQRDPKCISSYCNSVVDSILEDSPEMEDLDKKLDDVVESKNFLRLKEGAKVDMSWRIPSTSLVVSSGIFGRDKDKEEVIKLLLDDTRHAESPLIVIPIWGLGGIGKTTLAQLIYSDAKVVEKFNTRAWVCVSENFDPVALTRTILQKISPTSSVNTDDFDSLQTRLKEALAGKTFLIVLDDVWHDQKDTWEHLLKPFQYGNYGSKILLTTRTEKVASVVATTELHYQLSLLSDEDCWLVFLKQVNLSTDSINPTLEKVGKDIVNKCNGLPLAAQGLGGLLRGNSDVKAWNLILKSEIWEISEDTIKVVPALRISYYYLPSCLKRCFVYCSLFPKDYKFDKEELVLLWMAENFLQAVGKKTPEDVGDGYFEELVARSFFQPHRTREKKFVMHDLVHDLALIFAGEFCSTAEEHDKAIEIGIKTRHLSHIAKKDYPISKLLEVCERVKHTRTFLEINLKNRIPFIVEDAPCILFMSQLKYLRALSFKSTSLESLPDSIGELIHLRYLNLSGTNIVTLPESLGRLYNLQTLKLYQCYMLKLLPVSMQNLVNLRHLDIRQTRLKEMPIGMSKLRSLQFLSNYVVGKHEGNKIRELGALANLQKSICITNLEHVVNSIEASKARMSEKDGLDLLRLYGCWSSFQNIVDFQNEKDILDKLRPHSNLKQLEIEGYWGATFPDWVGHSSHHNITKVTLAYCRNCYMLPSLGQLPSLKHLEISDFSRLEIVGAEFYRDDESSLETPFPMLETLSFESMPCWKEWHSMELNAFPQLRELTIRDCPMLRGDLPNHLPSLQSLEIQDCVKLSCCVPRAPAVSKLKIVGDNEVVEGRHLVESAMEAIKQRQLSCLTYLSISDCSSHIWLPVSAIPPTLEKLEILRCRKLEVQMDGQQQHSLQELSISESCDSVTSFSLLDAFPNLKHVVISKCEKMECIVVSGSLSSLHSLEIFNCESLKSVSMLWMGAPQLENLILVGCPDMDISPKGDPPRSLTSLKISYSDKLASSATLMNSRFQGLTDLVIQGECESVSVKSFPKEGWLPASLEYLKLCDMGSVKTLECNGLAHLTSLQKLSISGCLNLKNIEGEKLPASLIRLFIESSPSLRNRCEMKDPQVWPKISHIQEIFAGRTYIGNLTT
ncbi:hypothetical protein PIB30_005898 [Stylosanthes scabra]|uniref:Disease resistance RPP13-like protein 1 n=1 Tax=Stylosanthes scabra TaxID=79078 RepID=A0ABU6Q449_9FABA|nr:hypothetical protein [Stylosanthes scabra]